MILRAVFTSIRPDPHAPARAPATGERMSQGFFWRAVRSWRTVCSGRAGRSRDTCPSCGRGAEAPVSLTSSVVDDGLTFRIARASSNATTTPSRIQIAPKMYHSNRLIPPPVAPNVAAAAHADRFGSYRSNFHLSNPQSLYPARPGRPSQADVCLGVQALSSIERSGQAPSVDEEGASQRSSCRCRSRRCPQRSSALSHLLPAALLAGIVWDLLAPAHADDVSGFMAGVNLAGAEFNSKRRPGRYGFDYIYPDEEEVWYFMEHGLTTFRIPFLWQRLQPEIGGPLDVDELTRLDGVVDHVVQLGGAVILDVHNYGRFNGAVVGSAALPDAAFADLWRRLAEVYGDQQGVVFGLMNEPHDLPAQQWLEAANAAIAAIRETGADNLVLVPGVRWSGAHSWEQGGSGRSNADIMGNVRDPRDSFAFEVHQYLDEDHSGTSSECISKEAAVDTLKDFTAWLRKHSFQGFLGEFGASGSEECLGALDALLSEVARNREVWIGWTYWAAGPWWGDNPFSVAPSSPGERPQLSVLIQHATQLHEKRDLDTTTRSNHR
jgi:endoglucanase